MQGFLRIACIVLAMHVSLPDLGAWTCTKYDSPICACNCYADLEVNGVVNSVGFSGSMRMLCGDSYLENDLATTEMEVASFDVTSNEVIPGVGNVTVSLDVNQTQPTTLWIANQQGSDFPGTHTVYAYCLVEFSNQPGVVWRSINPFIMINTNANSFNPSINEVYVLDGEVEFEDVSNPGTVVGRLLSSTITVNN